jgi:hypothetical protein
MACTFALSAAVCAWLAAVSQAAAATTKPNVWCAFIPGRRRPALRTDCSRGWLLWICAWRVPLTLAGCGWARRFVMADDLDADWKQDHSAIMPSLTKHLKKGGPSVCHVCRTADTDRRRRRAPRTPLSCLRFIPPLTYARACLLRTVRIRRHLL